MYRKIIFGALLTVIFYGNGALGDVPIFFIRGPFTFPEAKKACEDERATLAIKQDLHDAWIRGYNRCSYGWLRDMHTGLVMQEKYARQNCGSGVIGVLYTPAREPDSEWAGAYCTKAPIFFVSGPFTFPEAKAACEEEDAVLALIPDLQKAWNKGYNRCSYGWLRDMHTGLVMQEEYARQKCGGGVIGVLHTPAREPDSEHAGAYCTKIPIFHLSGPFTFPEAEAACERQGATLAMKQDLQEAWDKGYNMCSYGWLRDMHTALIMQEEYARENCGGGVIGVLYTPARDPDSMFSAYCSKEDSEDFDVSLLKIGSDNNKIINWWVTTDPAESFNLRQTLMKMTSSNTLQTTYPLLQSLKAVYTCCGAIGIGYTDEDNPRAIVTTQSISYLNEAIKFYRREMAPVKVFTQVTASYEAMMEYGATTTYRSEIISSIVEKAKIIGLDGLIMDYEPVENYTRAHAEAYRIFLDDFSDEMNDNNMTLGVVIASWGILKYFDIYASSKVDIIGSMSNTYYGHNLERNEDSVIAMMESIEANRLEIGLGLVHEPGIAKIDYGWSEDNIIAFTTWTKEQGIFRYHIYPGQWGQHLKSEEYFLRALANL